MILFMGIAPGNHPPDKSPTLRRIKYWMDSVGVEEYDWTNLVDYKAPKLKLSEVNVEEVANKIKGYSHIIALGNLPSTSIPQSGSFTTSIWFQYAGSPTNTSHMTMSGGSGGTNRFYVQLNNTSNIRYGNNGSFDDISISTVNSSNWYHLATVQSGTTVTVYLNGSSQGSATVNAISSDWGNNFRIGSIFSNTGFRWNGLLDEAAIWKTALDGSNIQAIYNNGAPTSLTSNFGNYTQSSNLVHWYRIGDHASDTVSGGGSPTSGGTIDNVENAANPNTNDGTGTNGPTYSTTVPA